MLENAIRDVWRRSRSNMHEYGKNSEGLSGNIISTYCITVTNNPISLGDLSVGSEVLHTPLFSFCDEVVGAGLKIRDRASAFPFECPARYRTWKS